VALFPAGPPRATWLLGPEVGAAQHVLAGLEPQGPTSLAGPIASGLGFLDQRIRSFSNAHAQQFVAPPFEDAQEDPLLDEQFCRRRQFAPSRGENKKRLTSSPIMPTKGSQVFLSLGLLPHEREAPPVNEASLAGRAVNMRKPAPCPSRVACRTKPPTRIAGSALCFPAHGGFGLQSGDNVSPLDT
jgi:hypothetical protein